MSLHLEILKRERWNNSGTPVAKHILSGQLLTAKWSYNRIGGCNKLDARFRFKDAADPEDGRFADPNHDDWDTDEWFGGEVAVRFPNRGLLVDDVGVKTVWLGRVTRMKYDSSTREIRCQGEGLVFNLDELHINHNYIDQTLRDILEDVAITVRKTDPNLGNDTYIRSYSIVGQGSLLDTRISIDAKWESARSVIQKVFEFLPEGMVWGVDITGNLYVDQQSDQHGANTKLTYVFVEHEGTTVTREVNLRRLRTVVQVLGKENEDQTDRVTAEATCEKGRALYGTRREIYTDALIPDAGMAQKVAAARCAKLASIGMNMTLKTVSHHEGDRSLFQSITTFAPMVAVSEALPDEITFDDGQNLAAAGSLRATTRRGLVSFGDSVGYSAKDKGSAGASASVASNHVERALNKGWLVHLAMRFNFANTGTGQDFLFGRPRDSATAYGWGSLWWLTGTGKLLWQYQDTGLVNRQIDTLITVPTAGSGTVVHFTVWRSVDGHWRFYNGNTLTKTDLTLTQNLPSNADLWRWWNHGKTSPPSGDAHGDFEFDEFWVINTSTLEAYNTAVAGLPVAGFISRTNDKPLRRGECLGLRRYCRFHVPTSDLIDPPWDCWHATGDVDATVAKTTVAYTQSLAVGTQNGAVVTTANRIGHQIGTEKKWGGPLILNAETVTYTVHAAEGLIEREFQLGPVPIDGFTTMAQLKEDVRRQDEYLRRVVNTF